MMVRLCVPRFDYVVSNSRATAEVAASCGVAPERLRVIPCGVVAPSVTVDRASARAELERRTGISLGNRVVVVTVGRLVRRKGAAWFANHVVPRLGEDTVYVVVGDGHDTPRLQAAARAFPGRVVLLGRADDEVRISSSTPPSLECPRFPSRGTWRDSESSRSKPGCGGFPCWQADSTESPTPSSTA